eukprot:TRINITY_DN17305_c0_g1_i1.p1 TRINITY_DN17305_c0_g1~~TRINITY_DN17305_c0_g1_i1.p1  ORF type:complete len:283 (-),score=98.93 TRINITY_DN17305_c0_g1_i1:14-862(-)
MEYKGKSETKSTAIHQVRAHEQWVKAVLISDLVDAGDYVCELCCGKGVEMGKWVRAKVGRYTGIDPSSDWLLEAHARWEQKKRPFEAEFLTRDVFAEELDIAGKGEFDHVCCFQGLEAACEREASLQRLVASVAALLKPGGFFFGIVPDSSAIWHRAQKASGSESRHVRGQGPPYLWSIELDSDDFRFFGCRYQIKLDGVQTAHYLIHFSSFIQAAAQAGLQMIEITNLNDFYEDHRKNHVEQLKQWKVTNSKGQIDPSQKEIIGLYTTFVFQKPKRRSETL